jgi:hypothetical protein
MAKDSYEARCDDCGTPAVVPRRDAERIIEESAEPTYTWFCRCGRTKTAPLITLRKPQKTLQRGGSLKRKSPAKESALAKRLRKRWATSVGEKCANCGKTTKEGARIEGHHVARKELIKARAREQGWTDEKRDRHLWDLRNKLDLCQRCHLGKHHNGGKLAWSLVQKAAPEAIQFAREIGLLRRVARDYSGAPK